MTELPRQDLPRALQARLRRLSMIVRILIVLGAVALVAGTAWVWVVPGHATSEIKESAGVNIDQMALHTQVIGGLWSLLPVGIVLAGLHRLWRLFGEYALGRVFSHRALVSLRGFARCVLTIGFVSPLHGALLSVIVTWDRKPGTREFNLQFSSDDYAMLLLGAVLLAIASVMAEAARVAEDHAGFV
jgi:hypothetical protein